MYYNKFVKSILLAIWVPFLSLIAAIMIIDPFQIFHKSWIHPGKYVKTNIREMAYGIIRNEVFDSVITCSSIGKNFSSKEASSKLGGKFINLSSGGYPSGDRCLLLNSAFKFKKLNIVIISFDIIEEVTACSYNLMYGSFADKLAYYCNGYTKKLISDSLKKNNLVDNLDYPEIWLKDPSIGYGLDAWVFLSSKGDQSLKFIIDAAKLALQKNLVEKNRYVIQKNDLFLDRINRHFISFIKKYQNTLFIIFLPPRHKTAWMLHALSNNNSKKYNEFEVYKARVKYLVNTCSRYNNALILGFDNESFTNDVNRYADMVHYDEKVNSFIIDAIKNKTHILTAENVDSYLEKFEKGVLEYDIKSLYEQIKKEGIMLE